MSDYDTYIHDKWHRVGGTAKNELATVLVRTRSLHHYSCPHLAVAVDPVRMPIAGSTHRLHMHRLRTHLSGCVRRNLEGRDRIQERAFAKAAGSLLAVRTRPSGRCCSRRCNGPQRSHSGGQHFHREG